MPRASWDSLLCYIYLKYLFPLFQWHACELAELSACIAKCMITTNEIYISTFFFFAGLVGMAMNMG